MLIKSNYIRKFKNAIKGIKEVEEVLEQVEINGTVLAYDSNTNTFYYSISEDNVGKNIKLNIILKSNKLVTTTINEKKYAKKFSIDYLIDYNNIIKLDVESILSKYTYYIKFTNLPTVSLF